MTLCPGGAVLVTVLAVGLSAQVVAGPPRPAAGPGASLVETDTGVCDNLPLPSGSEQADRRAAYYILLDIDSLDETGTQVVAVCDRDADFFESFDERRQHPRVERAVSLLPPEGHRAKGPTEIRVVHAAAQAPTERRTPVARRQPHWNLFRNESAFAGWVSVSRAGRCLWRTIITSLLVEDVASSRTAT